MGAKIGNVPQNHNTPRSNQISQAVTPSPRHEPPAGDQGQVVTGAGSSQAYEAPTKEVINALRKKVKKKCEESELFHKVISDEDDLNKLFKACDMDDLEYIDKVDLKLGYIQGDLEDKRDFFTKLPEEQRYRIVQTYMEKMRSASP